MGLFAHHMHGVFEVEIFGREFPDGPTEHVIALVLTVIALALMVRGAFAAIRDWRRWRRPAAEPKA